MRYTSDERRRNAFRDWLRAELARLDFFQRRGERYLVSEFSRYARQAGARVEEVSLGRYLRDDNPVLPTPESCRELARALGRHPVEVLLEAGYLVLDDFLALPEGEMSLDDLCRFWGEVDQSNYLPQSVRALLKATLERRVKALRARLSEGEGDSGDGGDDGRAGDPRRRGSSGPARKPR